MFLIFFSDTPNREVRAEEIRHCRNCKKKTVHRYEEISFHATMMFVKVFCYKKRFMRICSECGNGEELDKEQFFQEIDRLIIPASYAPVPSSPSPLSGPVPLDDTDPSPLYRRSRRLGIKFCRECGQKIFPDIGYCTACAVRGSQASSQPVKKPKKAAKSSGAKSTAKSTSRNAQKLSPDKTKPKTAKKVKKSSPAKSAKRSGGNKK